MKQYFPELINKDILSKNKLVLNYVKKITKKSITNFLMKKNFGIIKKKLIFFLIKNFFESFDFKQNKFEKKSQFMPYQNLLFIILFTLQV